MLVLIIMYIIIMTWRYFFNVTGDDLLFVTVLLMALALEVDIMMGVSNELDRIKEQIKKIRRVIE